MKSRTSHLILYMATFIFTAIPLQCIGALIPYLAQDLGINQTEYSLIFVFLSIGAVLATIIYKGMEYYHKLPKHHILCLIVLNIGAIGCFTLAFLHTRFSQSAIFLILGTFGYFVVIVINICLVRAAPSGEIGMWVGFSHGAFGVGALVGPLLVPIFEIKLYIILAFILSSLSLFFYFLPSPSDFESQQENSHLSLLIEKPKTREGTFKMEVIISLAFFILVGIETTIPAWAPTYAVKSGINDKQGAAKLSSIFWILSTIFRFVFGWLKIKQSLKFKFLIAVQLFSGLLCTILSNLQFRSMAVYLCSIFYGIGLSHIFPLLLSTPSQFGITFSDSQISNMMTTIAISSGTFSSLTGILMNDDIDMFFYSIVGFSLLLTICSYLILKQMSEDEKNRAQEQSSQLKDISNKPNAINYKQ